MSDVYYEKYLKYKSKYISLVNKKKLIGNHPNVNLMSGNVRKNMTGGAAEAIGLHNQDELDKVNSPFNRIIISKIFTSESDAKQFIDNSTSRIGKENIISSIVKPYGPAKTIDVKEKKWVILTTVTKKQVFEQYMAVFTTSVPINAMGKELALELINEKNILTWDMKYTINVEML